MVRASEPRNSTIRHIHDLSFAKIVWNLRWNMIPYRITRWSLCPTIQWRLTLAGIIYMEMNAIQHGRDTGAPRCKLLECTRPTNTRLYISEGQVANRLHVNYRRFFLKKMTPNGNLITPDGIIIKFLRDECKWLYCILHIPYPVTAAVAKRYILLMLHSLQLHANAPVL